MTIVEQYLPFLPLADAERMTGVGRREIRRLASVEVGLVRTRCIQTEMSYCVEDILATRGCSRVQAEVQRLTQRVEALDRDKRQVRAEGERMVSQLRIALDATERREQQAQARITELQQQLADLEGQLAHQRQGQRAERAGLERQMTLLEEQLLALREAQAPDVAVLDRVGVAELARVQQAYEGQKLAYYLGVIRHAREYNELRLIAQDWNILCHDMLHWVWGWRRKGFRSRCVALEEREQELAAEIARVEALKREARQAEEEMQE